MGTIMHKGEMYGGGVLNIVHKTWEQYQALSEAEKHDASKYYFVPDAPAKGVPGVVAELRDDVDTINSKLTVEKRNFNGTNNYVIDNTKRTIFFNGGLVGASGLLGTLDAADRPSAQVYSRCVLYGSGSYYSGYITINPNNGNVVARFFVPGKSTDAIAGVGSYVYGEIVWYL